ncbi:alginate lyase family protein [Joostella sp.]|uniref:alginate lyase family protein n=1 Tax=Joostella sp. TaxID=2231138 RepID=UPI003A949FAF
MVININYKIRSVCVAMLLLLFFGAEAQQTSYFDVVSIEKERILTKAEKYLEAKPITVTSFVSDRSAGGVHDFYSEGDYWWPDPNNPKGPYIRKDGLTNPDNFTAHREVMIRFNDISGTLASAYIITKNPKYIKKLIPHLKAWFIDEDTFMNPSLLYAQAISGKVTGRGIGIIDTIHLMEVAKAVMVLEANNLIDSETLYKIKDWFSSYLNWITTHPYGIAERDHGNNHSVCWAMQAAVFAELTSNKEVLDYCSEMYKNTLLPQQMDKNGGFPQELERTKPYGYSLFTLDAMTAICQVLSGSDNNLFEYTTNDGKNIQLGLEFMSPFVNDKSIWPYQKDVMYWEDWPVQHSSFLFGGLAFKNQEYLLLWKSLKADYKKQEIIRNMPIRHPLLWL